MDLRKLIEDYLEKGKLMQIATVKEGKPWVASVWYSHDSDWNLYFISQKERRHSQELKSNPYVAGAIVVPHTKGSGETVRGLQFEGKARATQGDEIKKARGLYLGKYPFAEQIPLEKLEDPHCPYPFYIIQPSLFVLFDEMNFPDDPRQEYKL